MIASKSAIRIFFLLILSFTMQLRMLAQENVINGIAEQFDKYRTQALQEKLFVHTDKNFYVAGEIMWFKVYVMDGHFNKPLDLSKIAYVEIYAADQKPVLQAKISLKDANGNGSFLLPFTINSGNYIIRAYTSWMKNFLPEFYFEKTITIVNPSKRPSWSADDNAVSYDIQFFPEGGNLVNGIQSKIAFRVADRYRHGVDCSGAILNQKNDTLVRFQSLKFGLGNFIFTPVAGDSYTAILNIEKDKTIKHELPVVYQSGFVMNLSEKAGEQLVVSVQTNIPSENSYVYLFTHTRHLIKLALAKKIENGRTEFLLDKKTLGDGISQLTVFNANRQPVCERLYFKRPSQNLLLDIKSGKEIFNRREKVNLDLFAHHATGNPSMANMSMSVFYLDSLQSSDQNDIFSYLWLVSDLKGTIESPSYYIKNTGPEAEEAIDNLMLTHGWRRFRWEDITQNKKPAFEFLPEYDGHIVNGKVIDKRSGLPAENIMTYLSVPGTRFQLNISSSNQKGQIRFDIKDFYSTGEIVIQTNTKSDSLFRIEVANPYSEKISSNPIPKFDFSEQWVNQLLFRNRSAQVQNSFVGSKKQQLLLPYFPDSTAFYGVPDRKYFLDDYTRFVTMEEVMREYVVDVRVRKQRDQFHYAVMNIPYKVFFENDPMILLDGVPVFDVSKIIAFDPLKIKKIEIVGKRYSFDSVVNEGIVSYSSYDGNLAGFQLDPNALILEYPGLQLQREFFSPVYETAGQSENRTPDFRDLLYWSPDINTNEDGKKQISFYTSDLPGTYAVMIQGIDATGYSGSGFIRVTVKK